MFIFWILSLGFLGKVEFLKYYHLPKIFLIWPNFSKLSLKILELLKLVSNFLAIVCKQNGLAGNINLSIGAEENIIKKWIWTLHIIIPVLAVSVIIVLDTLYFVMPMDVSVVSSKNVGLSESLDLSKIITENLSWRLERSALSHFISLSEGSVNMERDY